MVTVTAVTLGKGAAGKSRRPEGSRKERLRSFKHPGVRGQGLGLRGSHPPWGEGARKRKGLGPQGSALAHGVTSNGHRSRSQGDRKSVV